MSIIYDEKSEYSRVVSINDENHKEYINNVTKKNSELTRLRDKYNGEISVINSERSLMRDEIRQLYEFLKSIGGKLGDKVTIFDFQMEAPVYYEDLPQITKVEKPLLEEKHWVIDAAVKNIAKSRNNKKKIEHFEVQVTEKKNDYDKDISKRDGIISFVKDANEIAAMYRQVITIVRDAIRDKIIPEIGLIKAFLYADAIREVVLDGDNPGNVQPCSIEEYKGTAQDIHYQFVRNAVDFYTISTSFFKQTILYDIIEDKEVTWQEKRDFNSQIEAVKNSIKLMEEKKVV